MAAGGERRRMKWHAVRYQNRRMMARSVFLVDVKYRVRLNFESPGFPDGSEAGIINKLI
jgi:hypothetical protein